MSNHSPAVWVLLTMWVLVTVLLIPSGLIMVSDKSDPEWAQALGAGFLIVGTLSAGFFLLYMSDQH